MSKDWKNIPKIEGACLTKPHTHTHIHSLSEEDKERLPGQGLCNISETLPRPEAFFCHVHPEGAKCL